ncbi:MAG: hypothetical protein M4579_006167 [Chaenotheca gracillima]|nr:MAG: hypothetical protein M4579_006167 [Chaenotheca gracillima]
MAAPETRNIRNMSGVWSLNKTLSDNMDAMFRMEEMTQQGIPWIIRKIINYAGVELEMKQSSEVPSSSDDGTPVTSIAVKQTVTPGGFNSNETYVLDWSQRDATVPLFGSISVYARYLPTTDLDDSALREKLTRVNEDATIIEEVVKSTQSGWQTTGIWGFEMIDGKRFYTRNTTTVKGEEQIKLRLVYDFVLRG